VTTPVLEDTELRRLLDSTRYPLQYHALVVEVTAQCNAACAMCYQSAGPRGSDALGAATLDTDSVLRVIREAMGIEAMDPRVHITGGEAFLRPGPLLRMLEEARRSGYRDIVTTTNATWARNPARARHLAEQLGAAGLTRIAISWDHWHRPFIRPAWVEHCVNACADAGIECQLRIATSRDHGAQEALELLDPAVLDRVDRISGSPVQLIGRAASALDPAEVFQSGSLDRSCHSTLSVTVNAWGNVFPCCSGFDQTTARLIGNVRDEPLPQIVERMGRTPLIRVLVLGGIAKLYSLLGEDITAGGRYKGICHACWSLFDDPGRARQAEAALDELVRAAAWEQP